jgi:eukaryotic-like serine/threonine-protein kinase
MNDPMQTVDEPEREAAAPIPAESMPRHIGRYRVERVLGKGSFGLVYLAHDEQLQRPVAVKVPHRNLISHPEDFQAHLTEARTVASLDHPNIVPVYDVGSNDSFPVFIVSKYIEGTTLAQRIKDDRPSLTETMELVATIAATLHYAHGKGLVHRDVKPGNILLDNSGKPFVGDFGLALREQDVGKGPRFAGTPAYMSPEQARGEGHRVDGRSDLFSLGIVLYELLTGRRPFKADSIKELRKQIASMEARPPRQWDDAIPRELERICLKALSKRASERYATGQDMADDLCHFFTQATENEVEPLHASVAAAGVPWPDPATTPVANPVRTPSADSSPVRIVPKGLRSFDAHDADFFLELLPGPRDREGLPDSIRFWKTRIEERDADSTFAVGLIYGPSGCGKSSLVKAGLLPRLSDQVIAVYVEATAEETEARLLNGLRKRCPDLPANLGLNETLAALRLGQGILFGKKVLIILDQFEQWLHAKKDEQNTELVQALRQCDGSRVQCLVLVRDDFWLAVSRFMRELEVRLLEGQNSALADLFDLDHAQKVLGAFGRAFGKLPEKPGETTREQKEFLNQVMTGLAQGGKIICVQLALFAEMMKGKAWTPATLKEVGGTEGIGVTFLEETFSAATAPPEHRYHQKAARAMLKALLPESGTDIKGHMRSHAELLAASGYTNRDKDFDDLIRILDSEIRLLTPTDPEGKQTEEDSAPVQGGEKYYQLTHDYLVPSLRDWLTRKQKETKRGRAELLLADRAAVWKARPESRQLPSLVKWMQIRCLTQKKNWTSPQRKMMQKAARYHAGRVLVAAVLSAFIGWGVYEGHGTLQAHALRDRLLDANTNEVPTIVQDMAPYRRWLAPLLHDADAQAEKDDDRRKQLHIRLALLPGDSTQVEYLYARLLDAKPPEVAVIREALADHKGELVARLWGVVEKPEKGKEQQRLGVACALANYDLPDSEEGTARWRRVSHIIAVELLAAVQNNPSHYDTLLEQLRPVRDMLLPPLTDVFRSKDRSDSERSFATNILAHYAADQPQVLTDLLLDADEKQFAVIYPKFKEQGERGLTLLIDEINKKPTPELPSSDGEREKLAKRQANAATALLKLNQSEKVWPLLKHSLDPRGRSYLIHRFSPLGVDAGAILKRLDEESDLTIRRALLLSLGEYGEKEFSLEDRKAVLPQLQDMYRTAADAGLHGAAEWLLRTWQQETWLKQVNDEWTQDKEQREKRLERIQQMLAKEKAAPQWYVNGQGQTMVVIPNPVEFLMGSPSTEEGRANEPQHKKRIGRTFALAAKSVTVNQFRRFLRANKVEAWFEAGGQAAPLMKRYSPEENGPILLVDWYHAALYCNWLSEQEGIPAEQWCYETNAQKLSQEKLSAAVMLLLQPPSLAAAASSSYFLLDRQPQVTALRPNYLSLTGYRLPTEAEWEYACRAGAVTSRYYGETEELLAKYAWYGKNAQERTWPVGRLKPNDWGLFDMHGNVYTWCQDRFRDYVPSQLEDKEDIYSINSLDIRALRGGAFLIQASTVRSAFRVGSVPANRNLTNGLRPARTHR